MPGLIYFHWLGHLNGNRDEFLDEAVEMADHSVLSILIQGYFPWTEPLFRVKKTGSR